MDVDAPALARSATSSVDRAVAARTFDCGRMATISPAGPTCAAASESTVISRARTEARSPSSETTGEGRPGRPSGAGRSSDTRPAASSSPTWPADGASRQARPQHELGPRQRPAACSARTIALRLARRTVSLRWPIIEWSHRRWSILSPGSTRRAPDPGGGSKAPRSDVGALGGGFVFLSLKCRPETLPLVIHCQAQGGRLMGMLDGRVALITGASRGIGAAIARALAAEGAQLGLASRSGSRPGHRRRSSRSQPTCAIRPP